MSRGDLINSNETNYLKGQRTHNFIFFNWLEEKMLSSMQRRKRKLIKDGKSLTQDTNKLMQSRINKE